MTRGRWVVSLLLLCAGVGAGAELDEVVVTAPRVEPTVTEMDRERIERSAATTTDDLLRAIPGFALLRRSSSLVAHPTTQGAALRGVPPAGASRVLVLRDGVPLNDPFGGWVYWSRLPLEEVARVRVAPGSAVGPWGSPALGGVIDVTTVAPDRRGATLSAMGGTYDTVAAHARVSERQGPLGASVWARHLSTGGYPVVRDDQRGPIDVPADAEHTVAGGRIEYRVSPVLDVRLSAGGLTEERGSGTPLTRNHTGGADGAAAATLRTAAGVFTLTSFGQWQSFASTFSSQAPDRRSEEPALDQFDVPSTAIGGALGWSHTLGRMHRLSAGVDARRIEGETNEDFRFQDGRFTGRRRAGGEQQLAGAWLQDAVTLAPRWWLTTGIRLGAWRQLDGSREERNLVGAPEPERHDFPDRDRVLADPAAALRWEPADLVGVELTAQRTHRVPTLNELVRPFRVRNDITAANARLDPERLTGGTVGVDGAVGPASGRLTGFWNELEDPIVAVTAPDARCGFVPEGGSCRQRRNLDRARVRGVDAEVALAPLHGFGAGVRYLFTDGRVVEARDEPSLEGKRLPQMPRHQLVGELAYRNPRLVDVAAQVRWSSEQAEDDRNRRLLAPATVVDLVVAREVVAGVRLFLAVENVANETVEAGRSADGLITVGAPRLVHGGVAVRF